MDAPETAYALKSTKSALHWSSFIGALVPRELRESLIHIQHQYLYNIKAGPHVTLLDPFLEEAYLEKAMALMQAKPPPVKPFLVTLQKLAYFRHSEVHFTVYFEPETEPPAVFHDLMDYLMQQFPQCDDVMKIGEGKFTPHLSVAKFTSFKDVKSFIVQLSKRWQPLQFPVDEIYVLARQGHDPYEVKHSLPLGRTSGIAAFGVALRYTGPLLRTLFVGNIPPSSTEDSLLAYFLRHGAATKVDILCNPDGGPRALCLVTFADCIPDPLLHTLLPFGGKQMYTRPLYCMTYPDLPPNARNDMALDDAAACAPAERKPPPVAKTTKKKRTSRLQ
uniref:RRM domain-containing protein n=1 Tax=Eutreptiella gymnastica TaxID=73025 RepID=A0A7S4CRK0_9EUGL